MQPWNQLCLPHHTTPATTTTLHTMGTNGTHTLGYMNWGRRPWRSAMMLRWMSCLLRFLLCANGPGTCHRQDGSKGKNCVSCVETKHLGTTITLSPVRAVKVRDDAAAATEVVFGGWHPSISYKNVYELRFLWYASRTHPLGQEYTPSVILV